MCLALPTPAPQNVERSHHSKRLINRVVKSFSNHLLGFLPGQAAVPATSVHPQRSFVHLVVVDYLATKHCRARLALAKIRRRITPEVAAVGNEAPREGVLGALRVAAIPQTVSGGGEERVHTQER